MACIVDKYVGGNLLHRLSNIDETQEPFNSIISDHLRGTGEGFHALWPWEVNVNDLTRAYKYAHIQHVGCNMYGKFGTKLTYNCSKGCT